MKRIRFFGIILVFFVLSQFFCSVIFGAQDDKFSLRQNNVVLPNSDIKFLSAIGDVFYAFLVKDGASKIFMSDNQGKAWQEVLASASLPREEFVAFATEPSGNIALASKEKVWLLESNEASFKSLIGPQQLNTERITSVAVGSGRNPRVLIGTSDFRTGQVAENGIYFFQNNSWKSEHFKADVFSLANANGAEILAVSSSGAGTFLNIKEPEEDGWNSVSGWPIEITDQDGSSPVNQKIINSRLLTIEQSGKNLVFIALNISNNQTILCQIKFPGKNSWENGTIKTIATDEVGVKNLDSFSVNQGFLAVGATVQDGQDQKAAVLLSQDLTNFNWIQVFFANSGTENCQTLVAKDGTVFAAISGQASAFCKGQKETNFLAPISLIDSRGEVGKIFPSTFNKEIFFVIFGDTSIFRVTANSSGKVSDVFRSFYYPERFNAENIRLDFSGNSVFIFEEWRNQFYFSEDNGLTWLLRKVQTGMIDPKIISGVWYAGKDGALYNYPSKRIVSGLGWVRYIEPGPSEKILAVGGIREGQIDQVSVVPINGGEIKLLTKLPFSADWQVDYSNGYVLARVSGHNLRTLADGSVNNWENIPPNSDPIPSVTKTTAVPSVPINSSGSGGSGSVTTNIITQAPTPTTTKTVTLTKSGPRPIPTTKATTTVPKIRDSSDGKGISNPFSGFGEKSKNFGKKVGTALAIIVSIIFSILIVAIIIIKLIQRIRRKKTK